MSGRTDSSAGWWDQLAVAALLGTDRRPQLETGSLPQPLSRAAAALSGDPAAVLLDLSALAVAYRRGGVLPTELTEVPDRAPVEPRPGVSRRAAALLAELMGRPAMVRYWCERAAAAGLVAPDRLLPELLDLMVSQPHLRPAIGEVLGERGRWLAGHQPRWATVVLPAAGDRTGERWQFSTSRQRTAWLKVTRRTDPAIALAALAGTWTRESGPDRVVFLGLLAEGLGPDDEEFLEAALDDPQPVVRSTAAELLSGLPGSAYGRRMADRARVFVRRERGLVRHRVTVEVPDELDAAAVRDGLGRDPAGRAVGSVAQPGRTAQQWWLEQVVAGTPLEVWERLLGLPPERAVLIEFGQFAQAAIRAGWVRAAIRQADRRWAYAVLNTGTLLQVERLLALLDADQFNEVLLQRLPTLGPGQLPTLIGYLSSRSGPWTEPVAAAALDRLLEAMTALSPLDAPVTALLQLISLRVPLGGTTAHRFAGIAATSGDALWRHAFTAPAGDLSYRARIHQELQ